MLEGDKAANFGLTDLLVEDHCSHPKLTVEGEEVAEALSGSQAHRWRACTGTHPSPPGISNIDLKCWSICFSPFIQLFQPLCLDQSKIKYNSNFLSGHASSCVRGVSVSNKQAELFAVSVKIPKFIPSIKVLLCHLSFKWYNRQFHIQTQTWS